MESLAQVGVQLLLFTLGLEFSLSKLRAVRSVALLGGPSLLLWGRQYIVPHAIACMHVSLTWTTYWVVYTSVNAGTSCGRVCCWQHNPEGQHR